MYISRPILGHVEKAGILGNQIQHRKTKAIQTSARQAIPPYLSYYSATVILITILPSNECVKCSFCPFLSLRISLDLYQCRTLGLLSYIGGARVV